MALAALLVIAVGFAPTFYLRPRSLAPLPPLVVAHGLIFTAWLLVLRAQTSLIAAGRTALHRKLGFMGLGLAVVMLVMGPLIAISRLDGESFRVTRSLFCLFLSWTLCSSPRS